MRFIVFDPICNFSGGKATEWFPILPATDGAVAMAISNLIVHEIGVYDKEFIRNKTNGPYLVKADGHYLRDAATGKPLIWDLNDAQAKPFDATDLVDPAIEGAYDVSGEQVRPSLARKEATPRGGVDGVPGGISAGRLERLMERYLERARQKP